MKRLWPPDWPQRHPFLPRPGFWVVLLLIAAGVTWLGFATGWLGHRCPRAAPTASCLSNLKQLGLAALMYAEDYDQQLPPWPAASPAPNRELLQGALLPYSKTERIFVCPPDPPRHRFARRAQPGGYGFNDNLARATGLALTSLAEPAKLILAADADERGQRWGIAQIRPGRTTAALDGLARTRHRGGFCAAFCDGHANWQHPDATRTNVGGRWQWVPEEGHVELWRVRLDEPAEMLR